MPRTCLACSSPQRAEIDKAIATGEPLRNIAKRVSISTAALFRHKLHVSTAIVKAAEKREEKLGDGLLDEMRRVQQKAWELLGKAEGEGDTRGSIVALRETRECVESLGNMLARAAEGEGTAFVVPQIIPPETQTRPALHPGEYECPTCHGTGKVKKTPPK